MFCIKLQDDYYSGDDDKTRLYNTKDDAKAEADLLAFIDPSTTCEVVEYQEKAE